MKINLTKVFSTLFVIVFLSNSTYAAKGIDEKINDAFAPIANAWESFVFTSIPVNESLSIPIVLIALIGGALFFTIYFSFVNIRKFPMAIKVVQGKYDFVEGNGKKAEAGKTVSVHYTGQLENGKTFDSSYPRKKPIEFPLGKGHVIEGWDEGIALLQVGDKARFVIPSYLGYGSRGAGGVIPPDATLIFDVELMDVKG